MSEQATTEIIEETVADTAPSEEPQVVETPPAASGNKEAAKYRKQLREVQAERDALKESLAQYQQDAIMQAVGAPFSLSFTPDEQVAGMYGQPGSHVSETVNGKIVPKNAVLDGVTLTHPEDLFTIGGVQPGDLMDDTGRMDPLAVETALKELYSKRPDLFKTGPQPIRSMTGDPDLPTQKVSTWQQMLQDAANK